MGLYFYHPSNTFKLGLPYHPLFPDVDKTQSGIFEIANSSTSTNENTSAEIEFDAKFAKDRNELLSILQFDASIEARYTFSLKSNFNFQKQVEFSNTTLVYVVYGRKTYIEDTIEGEKKLTEKGLNEWLEACKNKDVRGFQKRYGTEIVTSIRRGSTIALIYTFHFSKSERKESIHADLEAKWRTIKANFNFSQSLNTIDESLRYEIHGFQSGVSELTPLNARLANIIKSTPGDIPTLQATITDILNHVSKDDKLRSPIISVKTANVSDIGEIGKNEEYLESIELQRLIERSAIQLNNFNIENEILLDEYYYLKRCLNDIDFIEGSKDKINDKIAKLEEKGIEIFEAYKNCINAKSPRETLIKISDVDRIPISKIISQPFIIPLLWKERVAYPACHPVHYYTEVISNFFPVVQIKFPQYIDLIIVSKNGRPDKKITYNMIQKVVANDGSFEGIWESSISNKRHTPGCDEHYTKPAQEDLTSYNRDEESKNVYSMKVFLKNDVSHSIDIGNIVKPPLKEGLVYPHLSEAELKRLDKYTDRRKFIIK